MNLKEQLNSSRTRSLTGEKCTKDIITVLIRFLYAYAVY